jgi:hypothetical protein
MTTEPYASAKRVCPGSWTTVPRNGARSVDRMDSTLPNAVMVHRPVHASWLNQVEIYFSILPRKAITGGDFKNLDQLAERVLAFHNRSNTTAEPPDWTCTRTDLNNYLHRLNKHEQSLAA